MRTPVKNLFHRLDNPLSTVDEVLKHIDADFEARKAPLFFEGRVDMVTDSGAVVFRTDPGASVSVPTHCVIVNDKDQPLGVVGSRYGLKQYREVLGILDSAVNDGKCKWVAARSLDNGARIHAIMTTEQIVDFGGEDKIEFLFTVSTSHDGTLGLNYMSTPMHNASQTIFTPFGQGAFSIRHSARIDQRMNALQGALSRITTFNAECAAVFKRFAGMPLSDEDARVYFAMIVEDKKDAKKAARAENSRNKMFDIYKVSGISSKLPSCRGTLLGAVVAVWTWADYYKTVRKSIVGRSETDASIESRMMGAAAQTKGEAYWAALKLAKDMGESV